MRRSWNDSWSRRIPLTTRCDYDSVEKERERERKTLKEKWKKKTGNIKNRPEQIIRVNLILLRRVRGHELLLTQLNAEVACPRLTWQSKRLFFFYKLISFL